VVQKYRDHARTAPLDVVDEHAAHDAAQLAVKVFALAFALPLAVRRPVIINGVRATRSLRSTASSIRNASRGWISPYAMMRPQTLSPSAAATASGSGQGA